MKVDKLIIFANIFMLSYIAYATMSNATAISGAIFGLGKFYIGFFAFTALFSILNIDIKNKISKLQANNMMLAIYMVAITLIFSKLGTALLLNSILTKIYWFTAFFFMYCYVRKYETDTKKIIFAFWCLFIVLLFVYTNLIIHNRNGLKGYKGLNIVYYLTMSLPFILLIKNNVIKISSILLVGGAIGLSFKTTGMISYVGVLLVYFYTLSKFSNTTANKKIFKIILFATITSIAIIYLFNYLQAYTGGLISQKIELSFFEGGSGRDIIWQKSWQTQLESSFIEWLFGHKEEKIAILAGTGTSSHNDFLEILFYYGLVGLVFYTRMYFILISTGRKMFRSKYEYAPVFIASLVLLLVNSMFSHLLTYPSYFIILVSFWGIIIADFENKNEILAEENKSLCVE